MKSHEGLRCVKRLSKIQLQRLHMSFKKKMLIFVAFKTGKNLSFAVLLK